jgi:hypothetical protein
MSLPPASELETAVSFAKDPEMPTERRHPAAHSSPETLKGHGGLADRRMVAGVDRVPADDLVHVLIGRHGRRFYRC